MNTYYPIYLDLDQEKVLVIGGGKVAERKVRSLLRCRAEVRVVSPLLTAGLHQCVQKNKITYRKKTFTPSDLKGVRLAICATNDGAINRKAADEATRRGILLNVVDAPDLCNFIVPSTVSRGDLTVAISTGGGSPALAKKMRKEIEELIGPEYSDFLKLLKKARPYIQRDIPGSALRTRIFQDLVDSRAGIFLKQGDSRAAEDEIRQILKKHNVAYPEDRRRGRTGHKL